MKKIILLGASLLCLPLVIPAVQAAPSPNYQLLKTIPLPGADGWDYLKLDSAARRLYISHGTHVVVLDADSGKVVGDIPDTAGVHGVAIDPKSGRGFTSNGRTNTVTIFDLKTLKKISDVPVGQGTDAIVFEPVTERVFTFNGRAHSATAIDAVTGTVVGTVTLPGRPEFPVADGKGHLYDNIEDLSEIVAIDAKALTIAHTWPMAPGEGPSGLDMDRKTRRLFAVCANQKLVIMDADSGKVIATPTIGNGDDAASFDPGKNLVFCPNGDDGTMTVYHETTPDHYDLVQTFPTQDGARTTAMDEKTHHIFTVTAKQAPAQAGQTGGGRRGGYADGTFVVLEYGPK